MFAVERGPEVDGFPDLDSLLELGLLELDADAVLKLVDLAEGIEAEDGGMEPLSGLRRPSMHSMVVVLPAPLGPMRPKISPWLTGEGCFVNGDGAAVGLADRGDFGLLGAWGERSWAS